jgi:hypothetical protein
MSAPTVRAGSNLPVLPFNTMIVWQSGSNFVTSTLLAYIAANGGGGGGGYVAPVDAVAAGTTQGTATVVTFAPTYVLSGTGGMVLPQAASWAAGSTLNEVPIYNRTGATITVYPFSGDTIETNSANAGVSIPNNSVGRFSVDASGVVRLA